MNLSAECHSEGVTSQIVVPSGAKFVVDYPAPKGTNSGPNPLEALLSSLVSCENSVARGAAMKKGYGAIRNIDFRVSGDLKPLDLVNPITFHMITLEAKVDTDMTEEQLEEVGEIAHQICPVAILFTRAGVKMEFEWTKA